MQPRRADGGALSRRAAAAKARQKLSVRPGTSADIHRNFAGGMKKDCPAAASILAALVLGRGELRQKLAAATSGWKCGHMTSALTFGLGAPQSRHSCGRRAEQGRLLDGLGGLDVPEASEWLGRSLRGSHPWMSCTARQPEASTSAPWTMTISFAAGFCVSHHYGDHGGDRRGFRNMEHTKFSRCFILPACFAIPVAGH